MWGVKINTTKSNALFFHRRSQPFPPFPPVTLNNEIIPFSTSATSLGVTLDHHLTFYTHISTLARRARQRVGYLHPFLRSPAIQMKIKLHIYYMMARAHITSVVSCCSVLHTTATDNSKLRPVPHYRPPLNCNHQTTSWRRGGTVCPCSPTKNERNFLESSHTQSP